MAIDRRSRASGAAPIPRAASFAARAHYIATNIDEILASIALQKRKILETNDISEADVRRMMEELDRDTIWCRVRRRIMNAIANHKRMIEELKEMRLFHQDRNDRVKLAKVLANIRDYNDACDQLFAEAIVCIRG